MKKKILIFGVLLAVTSVAAIAVAVKTTCGKWVYTIDEATYNSSGCGDQGETYQDYLKYLNLVHCGEYILPKTFEEV